MKLYRSVALVFTVATACGPVSDEPLNAAQSLATALDEWDEAVGRPASAKCRAMLDRTDIVTLNQADLSSMCHGPYSDALEGCMYAWDYSKASVAISEDIGTNRTLVHEYAHVLQWCEFGVIDAKHADHRIWDLMR